MSESFESTDPMMELDLRLYWQLFKHWFWLILAAAVLAGGTAYGVSRWAVEPIYRAEAWMVVQPRSFSGSSYTEDPLAGQR